MKSEHFIHSNQNNCHEPEPGPAIITNSVQVPNLVILVKQKIISLDFGGYL